MLRFPEGFSPEENEQRDSAFLDRLFHFKDSFLRIRAAMGIGENVGLGSIPEAHESYGLAYIGRVKWSRDETISFPQLGFLAHESRPLSSEQQKRIAVLPSRTDFSWLITLYQWAAHPDQTIDPMFLTASDEVYEGLIAHELAELYVRAEQPVEFVGSFLQQRNADKQAILLRDANKLYENFDRTDEAIPDVIAARLGYKRQIMAKLEYMQLYLETFRKRRGRTHGLAKPPETLLINHLVRIQEVERYS